VRAQFTSLVSILGRERRPKTRVAFPEIKNWRTLVIGIERQACAGTCPAYKLEIDGNGAVEYEGAKFVALQGKHHADIGQDAVRALYERFKKAEYFWLYDNYAGTGDRAQATTLTLGYDGKITRVSEFAGFTQNMPDVVRDLQIAIDRTVGVERWTKGNADTAPSLEVERWNFRSAKNENRAIVAGVAAYGDAQALARLIALGAPVSPNADLHQTLSADDMPVNALDAAILRGDPKILEIILAARAKWTREQFGEALLKAALIGRSDLAMALISAGADPNYTRPNPHPGKGRGAFRGAGHDGRSVLMNAASAGAADLVKVVLDAKPNVNAREECGWSALHFAAEPDPTQVRDVPAADRVKIVDMLVAAGAKPDAQTDAGDTPIAVCQRYSDVCTTLAKAAKAPPPPPLAAQKTSAKP
jgi:hypothetical protein